MVTSGHLSADCFSAAAGFSHILWMVSDPRLHFMSERGAVRSYQSGRPNKSFKTLQLVQNAAVLTGTRKIDHVGSPVSASLDWLSGKFEVDFKTLLTYKAVHGLDLTFFF